MEAIASPADVSTNVIRASQCPGGCDPRPSLLLRGPDRFHGRTELYTLLRCPNCSLVWIDSPPPPAEMGRHYGPDYDRSISSTGEATLERWRGRCATIAKYQQGGRILDLGCSSGSFLSAMPRDRWQLFGIEMSQEVAERARARCGATVFVGDVLDATFPPNYFDAITCIHVFEHVYKPKEVLSKVAEWLKPGGIFYTLMPNIDSAAFRFFKSYWYALELPRHLFHFSPRSLAHVAGSVGMKTLSLQTERQIFFELSARYALNDMLESIGIRRQPAATAPPVGLPFRVVRKAFRLTLRPILDAAIGLGGDKEIIEGIFQKPYPGSES
jgi:2-polyprenyl-3-methyl-5-hydroxy-6-metoxy-1,4-benzoquinol methylase